ncbi:MAG TPA: tetratricopeptide repeat protein [Rhodocyclaceae bacterium]|nr:tetratricopeptide repeat protein [Rhodocyclaceae bacterium]
MSLLMEALKKAEEAKRQLAASGSPERSSESSPSGQSPLELSPLDPAPVLPAQNERPQQLPDLTSRLELLDEQFMATAADLGAGVRKEPKAEVPAPSVPPPAPSAGEPRSRTVPSPLELTPAATSPQPPSGSPTPRAQEAAQNLFAAKQPAATSSRKTTNIAIGLATLIALAGIGIYFWLQLHPGPSLLAGRKPTPVAPIATASPTPPAPPPALAAVPPTQETPPPPQEEEKPETSTQPPPTPTMAARTADSAVPIRISHSRPQIDPALEQGFNALEKGDLTRARSAYEQALRSDPLNADALHGMAAILLRQGQTGMAESYLQRALDADPKDSIAQAGLINLHSGTDSSQSESRLRSLLADQPDSAALNTSLGNLLSRQSRWGEAQQAYFKALTLDGGNPDLLFNLAISLDRLHQTRLAAQYYSQALAAADRRPAGFDKIQAAERLKKLQP